jgi:hypothetical protein
MGECDNSTNDSVPASNANCVQQWELNAFMNPLKLIAVTDVGVSKFVCAVQHIFLSSSLKCVSRKSSKQAENYKK